MGLLSTLAQTTTEIETTSAAGGGMFFFVWLAVIVVLIAAQWKIFTKAGQPGWAAIVPFYNIYVIQKIVGRPGWWLLLYFIPFVNIIIALINSVDLAKSFGKDAAYGILLLFLFSLIGYLLLGFGGAQYTGPAAASAAPQNTPPATPPADPAAPAAV